MEKQTPPAPGFNAEPPPYAAVSSPHSMAPVIQPVPIPVDSPHHDHLGYHHGSFPQSHIVTQQPGPTVHVVTGAQIFGPTPRTMLCTACNHTINTKIIQERSIRTHLVALGLCLMGCWCCAPCVYCTDCCMNMNHYCSNCNAYQGTHIPIR